MRFLTEEQFEQIVHEEKIKFQKFIEQQTRDFYQVLYNFLDINNLWIEAENFFGFDAGVLTSAYVDFDETVNLLKQKVTPFGSCCFQVYGDKKPVINAVAKQSQKSKEIELVAMNETTFYFQFDCNYASCVHDIQIVQDPNENKKRIFENKKQWIELAKTLIDNCNKYGFPTWYEWCCHNWGTKWNASEVGIFNIGDETVVSFQTAWDCAYPVVKRLSEKFPNLSFTISFADEDLGNNCGEYTLINGIEQPGGFYYEYSELKDNPTFQEKAIRFACSVRGYDLEGYLENEEDYEEE